MGDELRAVLRAGGRPWGVVSLFREKGRAPFDPAEISQLVARGLTTSGIAAELVISPHTVRDHVKAVFAKAGVSSRGELVARLFAENYWPRRAGT
ncbi:helix-turn-helix transcriptional regulator [Actinomadura sp. B10D3]|uniref:response regulator transcription factor n=1 Tax=Actinomadura sp. B10D3 TaxID=3153557 RepID=UPI00325C8A86